jgi:hypothetical protein
MSLLGKLKAGNERATGSAASSAAPAPAMSHTRVSNGLKDFLWLLSDVERGHLLDLGPISQATVSFFTGRNFKVYTEDLLRLWTEHLRAEEQRLRSAVPGSGAATDAATLAENFLSANLKHAEGTFHAVLAWDVFDYLESELLPRVVARLHALLRPGGVMLAVFHSKTDEPFHRYRVVDPQTLELVPAAAVLPQRRALQNRELLNLFGAFHSSKTFVGRDQLREALFTR